MFHLKEGIAETLAKKQKEISVAEFFESNKQILGFDSPTKALLTAVKEGVDNSLDACEEASILPEIFVEIRKVSNTEYLLILEDNGPGIVTRQLTNVFGRLLYGSRFHAIRQSRGQQGIGISAVVMYGQLTTGKASLIKTKTLEMDTAYQIELMLDTKRNRPEVLKKKFVIWDDKQSGTRAEIHLRGRYLKGKQSPLEYLKGTAIVNPHAEITYIEPDGTKTVFPRVTEKLPEPTKEIKPHPKGLEMGTLLKMVKATDKTRLRTFLQSEFESVSYRVADEILERAELDKDMKMRQVKVEQARAIIDAIEKVKIQAPSKDCLSPIGDILIKKGLKNVLGNLRPDYYAQPVTREPQVYSGNPFQVEVGIVYGGELPKEQSVTILRFANRVPLIYQQGACGSTAAIESVDWRRYGLEQRGGRGVPHGPAVILVHVASTKVPFTSESKEAIADIPQIRDEIGLALRACARTLQVHLNRKARKVKVKEKFDIVQLILPKIAEKAADILDKPIPPLASVITKIMNVVWVDYKLEYVKKTHEVTIELYNYTTSGKKFNLYAVVPADTIDENGFNIKPTRVRKSGKIRWDLKRINSTDKLEVKFKLKGLDKGDFDEPELYVSGINPTLVMGAEALPGDWDLYDDVELEVVDVPAASNKKTKNAKIDEDEFDNEEMEESQ